MVENVLVNGRLVNLMGKGSGELNGQGILTYPDMGKYVGELRMVYPMDMGLKLILMVENM